MSFTADIDWITYVYDTVIDVLPVPGHDSYMDWASRKGQNGYDRGKQDLVTGLVRLTSSYRDDMGVCYIATSKVLSAIANIHGSASNLYGALQHGFLFGRASRLDVRADIPDEGQSTYILRDILDKGGGKYSARKVYATGGLNSTKGLTCYFGSPSSLSRVRVYDKFTESKGINKSTRIEVQLRGHKADKCWVSFGYDKDDSKWTSIIQSVIRSHIQDFEVPILNEVINGVEPFDFKTERSSQTSTQEWLLKQVLPTFYRDGLANKGNTPLLDWFCLKVYERLNPG